MNAIAFIKEMETVGILVWVEGDQLRVNAPKGAVTPAICDDLQARKPELVKALSIPPKHPKQGSIEEQEIIHQLRGWPDFEERVAVGVYEHGMQEPEAMEEALQCLLAIWLNTHPPSGPGTGPTATMCAECGADLGQVGKDYVALADMAWVHHDCHEPWRQRRRQEAIESLKGETQ